MAYPPSLDIFQALSEKMRALENFAKSFVESTRVKAKLRDEAERAFNAGDSLQSLINSSAYQILFNENLTDENLQARLFIYTAHRIAHKSYINIKNTVDKISVLNSKQYKLLKSYIKFYGNAADDTKQNIISNIDYNFEKSQYVYNINKYKLFVPLSISVVPDDTGFHVSCFETPQIYGFGETTEEAIEMYEREILSMQDDLNSDMQFSQEYINLKFLLNAIIKR